MRLFLTGGSGFLGEKVAQRLRDRGDEVIALVRSPSKAGPLQAMGCRIIEGTVDDIAALEQAMKGLDGVFHLAGRYDVGILSSERQSLMNVNVSGTQHVIDSAIKARIPKIVYASSIVIFGDTHGRVVDETYQRDLALGFTSCYDESKYLAHQVAHERAGNGAPIVIVQPGSVYGPGDHSEVGREILQAATGKLPALMLADIGLTMVHVDDVADGFIRAFDHGVIGESYVLGGEIMRLREVLQTAANAGDQKLPRIEVPTRLLKTIAPVAPHLLPKLGYPPNLGELIRAADNVTYWASDQKARADLGWTSRPFEQGIRQTVLKAVKKER